MHAVPLILCYHKIERRAELGVTRISPRRFACQMERLASAGWRTLSLAELVACVEGRRAPGPRELALTFDDAYRGLREHAFPVLESLGYRAICAVITGYAGRLNRWDVAYGGRRFAHLAWRDMRRWQTRGIEFVPHTVSHPRLTWESEMTMRWELEQSRHDLERALDVDAPAISYPFGAAGSRERDAARACGYRLGLTLATRWRGDPLAAPRLPVYRWTPPTPGVGSLANLEWAAAAAANRCAVGTTLWRRWRTRAGPPAPTATGDVSLQRAS